MAYTLIDTLAGSGSTADILARRQQPWLSPREQQRRADQRRHAAIQIAESHDELFDHPHWLHRIGDNEVYQLTRDQYDGFRRRGPSVRDVSPGMTALVVADDSGFSIFVLGHQS